MKTIAVSLVALLTLAACGNNSRPSTSSNQTGNTGGNNENDRTRTNNQPPKNCPQASGGALNDFIAQIDALKKAAAELKNDNDKYSLRDIRNWGSGEPINHAFLHCADGGEIKSITDDTCMLNGNPINIKQMKEQCGVLGNLKTSHGKFFTDTLPHVNDKPSALPDGNAKNEVNNYIKIIIDNFAQ